MLDGLGVLKGRQEGAVDVGRSGRLHPVDKVLGASHRGIGDRVSKDVIVSAKRS